MPPLPAFYHRPQTLEDIIDQTINRALDMLDIELDRDLFPRWQGTAASESSGHRIIEDADAISALA